MRFPKLARKLAFQRSPPVIPPACSPCMADQLADQLQLRHRLPVSGLALSAIVSLRVFPQLLDLTSVSVCPPIKGTQPQRSTGTAPPWTPIMSKRGRGGVPRFIQSAK